MTLPQSHLDLAVCLSAFPAVLIPLPSGCIVIVPMMMFHQLVEVQMALTIVMGVGVRGRAHIACTYVYVCGAAL